MIWVFALITLSYLLLMLLLLFGFSKVPEADGELGPASKTFSVVVPFRNEEARLPALLQSLQALQYPPQLYEVLLVNDQSEDASEALCREFQAAHPEIGLQLLNTERRSGSPKKDALTRGIAAARHEYILTTDADCVLPPGWLRAFGSFLESNTAELVAGPVAIAEAPGFLNRFQQLDVFSLQSASIGGFGVDRPFMCNGANLCFRKDSFRKLGGYQGNEEIASGDDVFLLAKFEAAGLETAYLKRREALVLTASQPDFGALLSQRIRWAAKTSAFPELFPKLVGMIVFLMNLLLLAGVLLLSLGYEVKNYLLLPFLVKFNVDFLLLSRTAVFFGREAALRSYLWASVLYPPFCVLVVLLSPFSGFDWKGRKFRK